MVQRILVIGGTGLLAGPVAYGLREAGFAVRVMSRDGSHTVRSMPYWLLRLIARLRGSAEMQIGVDMVAYLERVGERGDGTEANALLGAPQITLDQWLHTQKTAQRMSTRRAA